MSKFLDALTRAKNIMVVAHFDPDADAIASCLMTKRWLNTYFTDKKIDIFLDGQISDIYDLLIDKEIINIRTVLNYDTAIVLDCPNLERIGKYEPLARNCPTILNIDHHESNEKFGTLNYVSSRASSTGEILYLLFDNIKPIEDDKLAEYAYHAIITDTNNFSSLSMSKRTHLTLYQILEKHFDAKGIKQHYFNNVSMSKQYLIKKTINSMHFVFDDRIAIMSISYKDMQNSEANFTDTLGLVENGINISGVDIAIMFIEKEPNNFYVSLRSKNDIDVSLIAEFFGGGGHKTMAAFQYTTNEARDFKKEVTDECCKLLQTLPSSNNDEFDD